VILHDVNVLVYAYREDTPRHEDYRKAFERDVLSPSRFGYSSLVLSGFLRVVTHPKVFATPSLIDHAMEFVDALRGQPNAVEVRPGGFHWEVFRDLCRTVETKGNLVADAYHAALAIESGSEWVTTDRDYSRFPGLKWRHPLS
jgi:toxin-antitoxin system PIN domain toxin